MARERELRRPRLHARPQRVQLHAAGGAEREPREHGAYGSRRPPACSRRPGAGACLITDAFVGVETFFEPGKEILVAASGEEVAEHVRRLTPESARRIGEAALAHVRAEHTYDHRAALAEQVLTGHATRRAAAAAATPALA
jgi:hypothetical protein